LLNGLHQKVQIAQKVGNNVADMALEYQHPHFSADARFAELFTCPNRREKSHDHE
jgi:hypothetical protein